MSEREGLNPSTRSSRRQAESVDITSLWLALRARWWLSILIVAAGLATGWLVGEALGLRHAASLVIRATLNESVTSLSANPGTSTVEHEREQLIFQLGSTASLEELRERLGDGVSSLIVTAPEESPLLTVTAVADDPDVAATAASMSIGTIVDERRSRAVDEAEVLATRLREQAAALAPRADELTAHIAAVGPPPSEVGPTPLSPAELAQIELLRAQLGSLFGQQSTYEQRATDIEFDSLTQSIGVELVGSDVPTVEFAYPTKSHLIVLMGAAGFLVGLAVIWVAELRRGPRVTPARLATMYPGVPITAPRGRRRNTLDAFAVRLVDAVKQGSVISYVQVGRRSVDFAAGLPLAEALATVGRVTAVIEADLRGGALDGPVGLTSYLTGEMRAVDLVMRSQSPFHPWLVRRGPAVPNPLVAARDAAMPALIDGLMTGSHCVLVTVADPGLVPEVPLLIAEASTGIVELVPSRMHMTQLEDLDDVLARLGITVIGLVVRKPSGVRSGLSGLARWIRGRPSAEERHRIGGLEAPWTKPGIGPMRAPDVIESPDGNPSVWPSSR